MQLGWTQAIRIAWGRGQRIHKWLNCRIDRAAIWGPCMQSGNPALYAMVYLYLYLFIGVFHLALHCWKAAGGWWSGFSSKSVLWTNLRIFPGRRICLVHLEGIIFILFFLEAEVPDCRLVFQRVVGWDIYSNSSNLFWHFWLKVQKRGNLELQFGRLPWLSFPRKSPSRDLSLRPQCHQLARGWFEKSAPVSQTTSFCASSGLKIFKPPPPYPNPCFLFYWMKEHSSARFFCIAPRNFRASEGAPPRDGIEPRKAGENELKRWLLRHRLKALKEPHPTFLHLHLDLHLLDEHLKQGLLGWSILQKITSGLTSTPPGCQIKGGHHGLSSLWMT